MLRLIGGSMIAAAGAGMALLYRAQDARRMTELRQAVEMLTLMRSELEARRTPLPELAETIKTSCTGCGATFARLLALGLSNIGERSFPELWSESARRSFPHLLTDERRTFERLGSVLGRYELSTQLAALDRCTEELRNADGRLHEKMNLRGKTSAGLFCAGSLLLIIVLW